jgi:ABC-type dipeptide/oligopeptide/nickel transport system permease subunit
VSDFRGAAGRIDPIRSRPMNQETQVRQRLRQSKAFMIGAVLAGFLMLVAALAQPLTAVTGQDPAAYNIDLIDPMSSATQESVGGISGEHWLGVEPSSGRDVFTRLVLSLQFSLAVALGTTVVVMLVGVLVVFAILRGKVRGIARPALLCAALVVPVALLADVQNSFLGFGLRPPPAPSWGGMLSDSMMWYSSEPIYFLAPLLLLIVTVTAFVLLAVGLSRNGRP